MVGLSFIPNKSKEKQLAVRSEESDADRSSGLKDVLIKLEGVYWHTRTRTRTIAPVDYSLLARRIEVNNEHSAIIEPSLRTLVRGQPPLLTWWELLRRWPSDSKSRPESKGNNLIWFELSKNLSIPLSRCYHNCFRTKRNWRLKLLPRSPKANRRRGELIFCKYREWRAF